MSREDSVWAQLREAEQQGRRYCREMCVEIPTALVKCDVLKKALKEIEELEGELYGIGLRLRDEHATRSDNPSVW